MIEQFYPPAERKKAQSKNCSAAEHLLGRQRVATAGFVTVTSVVATAISVEFRAKLASVINKDAVQRPWGEID
jgi:hypothetical protein